MTKEFRIDQTIRSDGKYVLNERIIYHSPRYGKTITIPEGRLSDGATGAMDITSRGWWIHDELCLMGKWDDGTPLNNWQCSQVLQDILTEEGRYWQGKRWFWATWLFGGGKARLNGLVCLLLCLMACGADAAILAETPTGNVVTVSSLSSAATRADLAGSTVRVTSALSAAMSNISSASLHGWPVDRNLVVEKGGSIGNTTVFKFLGNFIHDPRQIFAGAGRVLFSSGTRVRPQWWGAADGVDSTAAVQKAIASFRVPSAGVAITDPTFGAMTMYPGGTIDFGRGRFLLDFDTLEVTDIYGLQLQGEGGRLASNYQYGATELVFNGTSTGYGIRFKGNGARSASLDNLSITYQGGNFTGDLIDLYNVPGVTFRRVYVGTDGITAPTRYRTAAKLIRVSGDEFLSFRDALLSGGVDGVYFDTNRSTFGGSATTLDNVTGYDFTTAFINGDGVRAKNTVNITNVTTNPITHAPEWGMKFNNINGLNINGSTFIPTSLPYAATEGWLSVVNSTGSVRNCVFGSSSTSRSVAGSIGGLVNISNNFIASNSGFVLNNGVITGSGNEFSVTEKGYSIYPVGSSGALTVILGPDQFSNTVNYSYFVEQTSTAYSGRVNYASGPDGSVSKYVLGDNTRITLAENAEYATSVATTPYSVSMLSGGTVLVATGSSDQVFNLPVAVPGVGPITIFKASSQALQIVADSGSGGRIGVGSGATKSSITLSAVNVGATVKLTPYATDLWRAEITGTWTTP